VHTEHEADPLSPTYQFLFHLRDPVAARTFHDSTEGSWSPQCAWKYYGLFYGRHNADGDCPAGGVHREYPDYAYQLPYTLN